MLDLWVVAEGPEIRLESAAERGVFELEVSAYRFGGGPKVEAHTLEW